MVFSMCSLTASESVTDGSACAQVFVLWGRDTNVWLSVADEAGIFTFNEDLKEVSYKKVS